MIDYDPRFLAILVVFSLLDKSVIDPLFLEDGAPELVLSCTFVGKRLKLKAPELCYLFILFDYTFENLFLIRV